MVVLDDPFVFILRPAKQGCTSFLRKSRASRKLLRRRDNGERGIGCDANAEIDLHSVGAARHWDGLDARQVQASSHPGAAGSFEQGPALCGLERQKRQAKSAPPTKEGTPG